MRRCHAWLGLAFAALASFFAGAVPVVPEQASKAASNWVRAGSAFGIGYGREILSVRTCCLENDAPFHVVRLKGGGFVVTSADTSIEPVIAFSSVGEFRADDGNPLYSLLRADMVARRRLRKPVRSRTGLVPERHWSLLLSSESAGDDRRKRQVEASPTLSMSDVRVAPLLHSAWSQQDWQNYGSTSEEDACYDYYTPNRYPCGCVATAGAQLMRYHCHPQEPVESASCLCAVDGQPTTLKMKGGTYDWSLMPLVPANGCTAQECEAIGRLTYDVGVACGMSYYSWGGSAADYMLPKALVGRFGYANANCVVFAGGDFYEREYNYTMDRFRAAVESSLDAKLPVVLGISSGPYGHAVVADGYGYSEGAFFIHVNLGWANVGGGDAWYRPPDIDEYDAIDSIVYNVWPTGAGGSSIVSGRVLDRANVAVAAAVVTAELGGRAVMTTTTDEKGIYALVLPPARGYRIVAAKGDAVASDKVDLSSCVSTMIDDDGYYLSWDRPQIGNVCGKNLTLTAEDPEDGGEDGGEEEPAEADAAVRLICEDAEFGFGDQTPEASHEIMLGVPCQWPLRAELQSVKKISVTGLPSGLKFATKDVVDRKTGQVTVAANTVYGTPKTASRLDANGVGVPSKVKIAVTLADKRKRTFLLNLTVAGLPDWSLGTFNGRVTGEAARCSAAVTVAKTGKISGNFTLNGSKWTLSAAGYEPAAYRRDGEGHVKVDEMRAVLTAKCGRETMPIELRVSPTEMTGTCRRGELVLWRNAWTAVERAELAKQLKGLYTLHVSSKDCGFGYLSLTVDAKGTAKVSGKMPDGTAVSGSTPLLFLDGRIFVCWSLSPSTYKGGGIYVEMNFATDAGRKVSGAGDWASRNPTATSTYDQGFSRSIGLDGAYYDKLSNITDFYRSLSFSADMPPLESVFKLTKYGENKKKSTVSENIMVASSVGVTGTEVEIDEKGKFKLPKAGKPVKDRETGKWTYEGENPAALSVSFAKATGIFKGSFTGWYDFVSSRDETKEKNPEKLSHTSKKYSFEGIFVQGGDLRGFFLQDKTGTYEQRDRSGRIQTDRTGLPKTKTYKYKLSLPAKLQHAKNQH